MSDLDPLIHLEAQDDPTLTRVLERSGLPPNAKALINAARTSCSIIVTDTSEAAKPLLDTISGWHPERIRVEALVVESAADLARRGSSRYMADGRISCRRIEEPVGGRACVLGEAIEQIENEFVIVTSGVDASFDDVTTLLAHMWSDGADVGMIENRSLTSPGTTAVASGDAAEQLAEWLGLAEQRQSSRLVLMRRWVARWLFNEISRSIDPAEELADRARLLGVTMVRLVNATV